MLMQPRTWMKTTGGAGKSGQHVRISAAHAEWNHVGIALAAMDLGIFAEEGLTDVEAISFDEESGALLDRERVQVDLLASGQVDLAIDPQTRFLLQARSNGKPVSIIAARRRTHAFVLIGERGLSSIQDLKGCTLCTSDVGGANDIMLRQVLQDSGIDPEVDVKITYSGMAMHDTRGATVAFTEGRYGPAILASTAAWRGLVDAGYPMLVDLRVLYPSRHDRVTAANSDFAAANPDLLRGFLRGMMRGWAWILNPANATQFKEIVVESGFLTEEHDRQSFDGLFAGWRERGSIDLSLPRDGIELIVDESKRNHLIPDSFDTDDVLDLGPLHEAHRELGIAAPA
ncbi:MAG: transporter substrate-binding protein [Chloroflexi bacterium]|nr:transporter substrate-binding protein [Chloroflexota bacterium]